MKQKIKSDYDSGWKEAIENYFIEFMAFFFPDAHEDIDFSKRIEFLDKEFEKIVKESSEKKRYTDKLVKVFLKNGLEHWILIHIEVQSCKKEDFEQRIYVYNYRIYDRYKKEVITLVILTDKDKSYRPSCYEVRRWGFVLQIIFPVIKLIDYKDRVTSEISSNPFSIITLAHLRNLETNNDPEKRLLQKTTLVKMLYRRGYKKDDILKLYRFIDWIMVLPEELSRQFQEEIIKYEEESKMGFITTAEKIGIEKGIKIGEEKGIRIGEEKGIRIGEEKGIRIGEGRGIAVGERKVLREVIEDLLDVKFPGKGESLKKKIKAIQDIDELRRIKEYIIKKRPALDEIAAFLDNKAVPK